MTLFTVTMLVSGVEILLHSTTMSPYGLTDNDTSKTDISSLAPDNPTNADHKTKLIGKLRCTLLATIAAGTLTYQASWKASDDDVLDTDPT